MLQYLKSSRRPLLVEHAASHCRVISVERWTAQVTEHPARFGCGQCHFPKTDEAALGPRSWRTESGNERAR